MRKLNQYGCVLTVAAIAVWRCAQRAKHRGKRRTSSIQQSVRRKAIECKTTPAKHSSAGWSRSFKCDSDAEKLPVRRVILYKSGVGYFERQGRVEGDQTVHIDFTSGQLNDVLQSLTVLDLNGGRIAGVNYNSERPSASGLARCDCQSTETPTFPLSMERCGGAAGGEKRNGGNNRPPAIRRTQNSCERRYHAGS